MEDKLRKNLDLRSGIRDLWYEIAGDIDHGECFYEKEDFDRYVTKLLELRELSLLYYESNKEDIGECGE